MDTPIDQTNNTPNNQAPLTPLADFRKSGRAPVEMHHLIFHHKKSLVEFGAICKFGRKWLVSEAKVTFSNGCVNRVQMREDQNEQTSVMLLNHN